MEALIKNAPLAWNPVRVAREWFANGELSFGRVLGPCVAIIVGCNLLAMAGYGFLVDGIAYGGAIEEAKHPFLTNQFAQKVLSTLGALLMPAVVSLLPSNTFVPAGRSATAAAVLIINAGAAFYGAAVSVPTTFLAGTLAAFDPLLGLQAWVFGSGVQALVVTPLIIYFMVGILRGILRLSVGGVITIFLAFAVVTVGLIAIAT